MLNAENSEFSAYGRCLPVVWVLLSFGKCVWTAFAAPIFPPRKDDLPTCYGSQSRLLQRNQRPFHRIDHRSAPQLDNHLSPLSLLSFDGLVKHNIGEIFNQKCKKDFHVTARMRIFLLLTSLDAFLKGADLRKICVRRCSSLGQGGGE